MGRLGSTTSVRARQMRRVLARWQRSGLTGELGNLCCHPSQSAVYRRFCATVRHPRAFPSVIQGSVSISARTNQSLSHCKCPDGVARRERSGNFSFLRGQKCQPDARGRRKLIHAMGVTRGKELVLEADLVGSGARAGTQLIKARPPAARMSLYESLWGLPERNRWTLLPT